MNLKNSPQIKKATLTKIVPILNLFFSYLKTILSLFLIVNLSYFNTILSLFESCYFETKNREKIALADRDN